MHLLSTLPVVLSSVLVMILSNLFRKLSIHRQRFEALPKPPHSFFFGHLHLFNSTRKQLPGNSPIGIILSVIQSQYRLPDVYYLDLWPLVSEPFLVTGDLAVADRFLNDYTRHPEVLSNGLQPLVGGKRGLVSPDLTEWHASRTSMRTLFSVANVQRFVPDIAQYTMLLRASLLERAVDGRSFPMIDLIEDWGADITFRFLVGDDTAVQQGGWGARTNADVKAIIAQADDRWSWSPWAHRRQKLARRRCQDRVRGRISTALSDALQRDGPASHNTFIPLVDVLVANYKEQYPGRISWDSDTLAQHLDTVMTMFLAADVSSMVLTYVFCHIAQDPAVAAELRREHNSMFPGNTQATLEDIRRNPGKIKQLPYTTAVIKESMRLRPPGVSATIAPKGHVINFEGVDHSLEGSMLFVNIARLQSHDSYVSSPFTFDPSRWLPKPGAELANSRRPFQRGQHSCMGENMMMPGLVIALLLIMRDIEVALAYEKGDVCLSPELGGFAYMDGVFAAKPARGLPVTVKALTR